MDPKWILKLLASLDSYETSRPRVQNLGPGFRVQGQGFEFRAQGSDFERSGKHFEQRVQTLGAPASILSKGFGFWAVRRAF